MNTKQCQYSRTDPFTTHDALMLEETGLRWWPHQV